MEHTSAYKILVAQDDAVFRQLLIRALVNDGFRCHLASDGLDAEREIERFLYDVVITGLILPPKNGYGLILKALSLPFSKRPVVVVLTRVNDPRISKDLITRGVDALVYRPVDEKVFSKNLRKFLDNRVIMKNRIQKGEITHDSSMKDFWNCDLRGDPESTTIKDHEDDNQKKINPELIPFTDNSTILEPFLSEGSSDTHRVLAGIPTLVKPLNEEFSNEERGSIDHPKHGSSSELQKIVSNENQFEEPILQPTLMPEQTSNEKTIQKQEDSNEKKTNPFYKQIPRKEIIALQPKITLTSEKNYSFAMVILGCIFLTSWTGLQFYSVYQQNLAVHVLQGLGAKVSHESQGYSVDAKQLDVTEIMGKLRDLRPISTVDLSSSNIKDIELEKLKVLKELKKLRLNGTGISDEGMQHLLELQQLRELQLKGTRVSSEKIRQLEKMIPGIAIDHDEY